MSVFSSLVADSPINSAAVNNRKTKPNGIDHNQQTKSCQNMKCIISPKQTLTSTAKCVTADYSDMERNNIYAETPPKTKSIPSSISPPTLVNGTNHYMPILQQQQRRVPPPSSSASSSSSSSSSNNTRNTNTMSTSSMSSFSTATSSSQATTPSNSFRHDATSIMKRSADASSSCGLVTQTKNGTNNIKSKSTYDIDVSIPDRSRQQIKETLSNNNNKCTNSLTNGNFVPMQVVKEDECLEVDEDRKQQYSKVDLPDCFLTFIKVENHIKFLGEETR